MPPDILETDITRAAREQVTIALAQIETQLGSIDETTAHGRYVGACLRFQREVVMAFQLWAASEDERGTHVSVTIEAALNGFANCLTSLCLGHVQPEHQDKGAGVMCNTILAHHRSNLADVRANPATPDLIPSRKIQAGRA